MNDLPPGWRKVPPHWLRDMPPLLVAAMLIVGGIVRLYGSDLGDAAGALLLGAGLVLLGLAVRRD